MPFYLDETSQEFKKAWVAELRSGRRRQVTRTLCKSGPHGGTTGPGQGHCCLGVALEVAEAPSFDAGSERYYGASWDQVVAEVKKRRKNLPLSVCYSTFSQFLQAMANGEVSIPAEVKSSLDIEATELPQRFYEALGITYEEMSELMGMNDQGVSFVKIADWIEREL